MKKIIAFYLLSATAFGYFISPDINKKERRYASLLYSLHSLSLLAIRTGSFLPFE